jgi:integrase
MASFSIRQHSAVSWRIAIQLPTDPMTGRRKTSYKIARGTQAEAEAVARQLVAEIDQGKAAAPSSKNLAAYLGEWLDSREARATVKSTVKRQRDLLELHVCPTIGRLPLQKLSAHHVQQLWTKLLTEPRGSVGKFANRRDKPLSNQTVLHAHRALSMALSDAVELGLLARNPLTRSRVAKPPPARQPEMELPSADAVETAIVTCADDRVLQALVRLAVASGARMGELLALRWGDIDLTEGSSSITIARALESAPGYPVKEPKGRQARRVSLTPDAAADLRSYRTFQAEAGLALGWRIEAGSPVFCDEAQALLRKDSISSRFSRRAGFHFHALRHYHASLLLSRGVDIVNVSRRLGHANPTVTLNVYAHVIAGQGYAALAALTGRR